MVPLSPLFLPASSSAGSGLRGSGRLTTRSLRTIRLAFLVRVLASPATLETPALWLGFSFHLPQLRAIIASIFFLGLRRKRVPWAPIGQKFLVAVDSVGGTAIFSRDGGLLLTRLQSPLDVSGLFRSNAPTTAHLNTARLCCLHPCYCAFAMGKLGDFSLCIPVARRPNSTLYLNDIAIVASSTAQSSSKSAIRVFSREFVSRSNQVFDNFRCSFHFLFRKGLKISNRGLRHAKAIIRARRQLLLA